MKVLALGCGNIGSVATEDLAENTKAEIVIADKNGSTAKKFADKIGKTNVSWLQLDITNHKKLAKTMKDFDLILGFLPGKFGYQLAKTCFEEGKDLVDVSYMPENPLTLNRKAAKTNVKIIPDCGLAPGISNVFVGHAVAMLDKTKAIRIMVGGLPEKPIPPLGYAITWSPENLIDEYTRKAAIVKKGRKVEVEALSEIEMIDFPGFGKLEAFYTDGLRTLLHTVKAYDMWEKTLRYSGHAEKIKAFEALGFFSEDKINVEGVNVSPKQLTVKLFGQKLRKPEVKDVVALKVEVVGIKNGKKTCYIYHLLDYYDEKRQITAMARTTAYTTSIIAQLMLKKAIKGKGVIPPEKLGMDNKLFKMFSDELRKRGIKVVEDKIDG